MVACLFLLQGQIERHMILFRSVADSVQLLVDKNNKNFQEQGEIGTLEDISDEEFEMVAEEMRSTAMVDRKQFVSIYTISAVYAEISVRIILPDFDLVNRLNQAVAMQSHEEIKENIEELQKYKTSSVLKIHGIIETICS